MIILYNRKVREIERERDLFSKREEIIHHKEREATTSNTHTHTQYKNITYRIASC